MGGPEQIPYQHGPVLQGIREETYKAGHGGGPGEKIDSVLDVWPPTHQRGGIQIPHTHTHRHGKVLACGSGKPSEGQE